MGDPPPVFIGDCDIGSPSNLSDLRLAHWTASILSGSGLRHYQDGLAAWFAEPHCSVKPLQAWRGSQAAAEVERYTAAADQTRPAKEEAEIISGKSSGKSWVSLTNRQKTLSNQGVSPPAGSARQSPSNIWPL